MRRVGMLGWIMSFAVAMHIGTRCKAKFMSMYLVVIMVQYSTFHIPSLFLKIRSWISLETVIYDWSCHDARIFEMSSLQTKLMKARRCFSENMIKTEQIIHWGEWPSGLRHCNKNRRVPGSKSTRCLAGLMDATSLRGSRWPSVPNQGF